MSDTFGQLLRTARESGGSSLGALARHLEVSAPYLSDVERNNRPPLVEDKIRKAAQFLAIDPGPLIAAASERRGAIQLDASHISASQREVGHMLAAMWRGMSEEKVAKMKNLLLECLSTETTNNTDPLPQEHDDLVSATG